MSYFKETTHLSEILEESEKNPVVIFIFSSKCGSSTRLSLLLEKTLNEKKLSVSIFKVTVQMQPILSKKIEEWFQIKHESPQIISINYGKVSYTAHHSDIKIDNFLFLNKL